MDNLTKEQRSRCMSQIKSKWTRQELKVHNYLKGNKIKHKMHPKIEGSPDIIFSDKKKAVFLHGCFWHKCPRCYIQPKSNKNYWLQKIEKNIRRDKSNKDKLKRSGWKVISAWEHEINRNVDKTYKKIIGSGY